MSDERGRVSGPALKFFGPGPIGSVRRNSSARSEETLSTSNESSTPRKDAVTESLFISIQKEIQLATANA